MSRARALVLAHGWNATAYQILNPGFEYWFAPDGGAVVGFLRHGAVRVAAGAPVTAADRLASATLAFERSAHAAGERVCWVGAESRLVDAMAGRQRHAAAVLGALPVWDPSDWSRRLHRHRSLRAQLNRAGNKAVVVSEWPARRAGAAPELHRVLHRWLAARALPPLRFLVEPRTLDRLLDRRIFVAECRSTPVGFCVLSPVPARGGWLLEQIVRTPDAPNGSMELLVDAAVRAAAAGGARYVTLGTAPLSSRAGRPDGAPLWLRAAAGWLRAHFRRFYNFEGLEGFKAKFRPDRWDPVFLLADGPLRPRHLLAVAGAYAGGALGRTTVRALGRAARAELAWMGDRLR